MTARTYPKGAAMAPGMPIFAGVSFVVNREWMDAHGGRAQRRLFERKIKRQARKERGA